MWINMKKNYPGCNPPIPGLDRCSYTAGRDYDLPAKMADLLVKAGYAVKTTAPWQRGTNPAMLEVERRKKEIEKLQLDIISKESALQNARNIALTIPLHEKEAGKLRKALEKKLAALEDYAAKNNIYLTKEAAEKARLEKELAEKKLAEKKLAEEAAAKEAAEKLKAQSEGSQNENDAKSNEPGQDANQGNESKDDSDPKGQAASTGKTE